MLPRSSLLLGLGLSLLQLPAQQFTTTLIPSPGFLSPTHAFPGDFDGDGTLDLLVTSWTPPVGGLAVFSRLANGTWGSRAEMGMGAITGVVIAELTGDGRPEVLVTSASPGTNLFFTVLTYSEHMQPTTLINTQWPYPVYGSLAWLRGDGDALPDLFSYNASAISFHRHLGGTVFAAPITTPIPFSASLEGAFLEDFTGDGYADAAYIDTAPPQIRLYAGDGAGGFLPAVVTPLPFYTSPGFSPIMAELNGDNRPDLILQGRVVLAANGGAFQITSSVLPTQPYDSGDFDGDGRTDVLCQGQYSVVPYLQQSGGTFVAGTPIPVVGYYEYYSVLDVNQDGRLDVLRFLSATSNPAKLILSAAVLPHAPPYVWPYGIGTPGCRGHVALSANADPTPGLQSFAITATNAPESSPGLLLASFTFLSPVPTEPFGLGFQLAWYPFNAMTVAFDANAYGQARLAMPIAPLSLGATVQLQAVWLAPHGDGACSTSPLGFVSSNALQVQVH